MPDSIRPGKSRFLRLFAFSITTIVIVLALVGLSLMPGNVNTVSASATTPLYTNTGISQVWLLGSTQNILATFKTNLGFQATGASWSNPISQSAVTLNYNGASPIYTATLSGTQVIYSVVVAVNISSSVNAHLPYGWTFGQGLNNSFMRCYVNITNPSSVTSQLVEFQPGATYASSYSEWVYPTYACYIFGIANSASTGHTLFDSTYWINSIGVMTYAPHYYTMSTTGSYTISVSLQMLVS